MKTTPRGLPLFRSDGQARVLSEVFLSGEGVTLSEIARRQNLSISSVHHEVERLERFGIVRSRREGRNRIVEPDESSQIFPEVSGLVLKSFGPLDVLRRELQRVARVKHAWLYGSWARRYNGEHGPAPRDIDVLVVGSPDPDAVYVACRRAERRLRMEVNPAIVSERDWRAASSSFLRQLRAGPLVPLMDVSDG